MLVHYNIIVCPKILKIQRLKSFWPDQEDNILEILNIHTILNGDMHSVNGYHCSEWIQQPEFKSGWGCLYFTLC